MPLDGLRTQGELGGDGLVGAAGGDEPQDFELAWRQAVRTHRRIGGHERIDARKIGRCTELCKHGSGGAPFQPRAVLVVHLPAREAQQHARARRGVRHLEPLPALQGLAQETDRAPCVSLGKVNCAARMRSQSAQHFSTDVCCSPFQLDTRVSRLAHRVHGEHDFDVRGEEARSQQSVFRRVEDASYRSGCGVRASLREAQQREPRLRLVTFTVGQLVGSFCGFELTAQAMDLSLLIERGGCGAPATSLRAALAGTPRLRSSVRPCTQHLQDLRAMHHAHAREREHLMLLLAPARERGRPLARPVERVDLPAGVDDAAVEETGDDGRQLSGDDCHHRLVEQREPRIELAALDQRAPLLMPGACRQIGIRRSLAYPDGARRDHVRELAVAGIEMPFDERQQQIAALDTLLRFAIEEPLRAAEPARRARPLAAQEELEAEPEGAARGTPVMAGLEMRVMCALERTQKALVAADQIGGGCKQLQIFAHEGRCAIGERERLPGIGPGALPVMLATPFELMVHGRGSRRRDPYCTIRRCHPHANPRFGHGNCAARVEMRDFRAPRRAWPTMPARRGSVCLASTKELPMSRQSLSSAACRAGAQPIGALCAFAMLGSLGAAALNAAEPRVFESELHDFRVVTVVEGLRNPWSIAFLPNGDMLVTEREGRLRIVRDGKLLPEPVAGVPKVRAVGQGGLMDVVPHPDYVSNRFIYLSYSKENADGSMNTTAVVRGRLEGGKLTDVQEIFEAKAWAKTEGHYGSRLAFDRNGYLFITVGDRMAPPTGDLAKHPAQDLSNHQGTTIRLHDDGRVPDDNPFVNRKGALPEIWSYGHRNAQGMAFHPQTGDLWQNEHGPQGGDELNLIRRGANYGWPVIGYGVQYRTGERIHEGTSREGMLEPVHYWVPSIGTSGLAIYDGDKFPKWRGNVFTGGLSGRNLSRVTLDGQKVVGEEVLLKDEYRIRDVRSGPDGFIYIAVDDRDGKPTPIVRLEPVTDRTTS